MHDYDVHEALYQEYEIHGSRVWESGLRVGHCGHTVRIYEILENLLLYFHSSGR